MIIKFQALVRTTTTMGVPSTCSVGTPQATEALAWEMIRKQAARLYPKNRERRATFISFGAVVPVMESSDGELVQSS